jgi:hypothetical protein
LVFRNYKAAFLWGFMAVFMTFVALMTWVLFRDLSASKSHGFWQAVIMGVFWIAGLGFSVFAASRPCVTVTVQPGTVRIVHQFPFSRKQRDVMYGELEGAKVGESRDSEGDPYFYARTRLKDGSRIDLFGSHRREKCETVCANFNDAVSGGLRAPRVPRKPD